MRESNIHTGIELTPKQINYILDGISDNSELFHKLNCWIFKEYLDKFEILVDDGIFYVKYLKELWEFDRIQDLKDYTHLRYYMDNNISDKVLEIINKNKVLDYNWTICWAIYNGHIEVVKLLLQDDRLDHNSAIKLASQYGHLEIVKLLLQDDRVDPSYDNNFAIRLASEFGHTKVVRLLLQDGRVDPSDMNNYAIIRSSENGHVEVVKLLLQDDRVDHSNWNNYAIKLAIINGHNEIVKLLIQHPKVREKLTEKQIEEYEIRN